MEDDWNLLDHMQMKYHHMWEEGIYPEDAVEILKKKLLESQTRGILTVDKINKLFGGIDTEYMEKFWKDRAHSHKINEGMTNLEDDTELLRLKLQTEIPKMLKYVNPNKQMKMLDLGSGYGSWSFEFADKVREVHAVDYTQEMIDIGIKLADRKNASNVYFIKDDIQSFSTDLTFDLILLSGVCLYLNDAGMQRMLKNMDKYSHPGTIIVLREGTGLKERYVINKEYSNRLQTEYSAIYRTAEEYIEMFGKIGFEIVEHEDMFDEDSQLNRFKETRLRIYKFRRMR